jgi:hypothetical protein
VDEVIITSPPQRTTMVRRPRAESHDETVMTRDGKVMTAHLPRVTVGAMSTDNAVRTLVLEEFRLNSTDGNSAAARIVSATSRGLEPQVPLLTSIDDRCDVATIRGLHAHEPTDVDLAQHAALDPLVRSWQTPRHYSARIAERSVSPASSFRLAVTESGINGDGRPAMQFGRSASGETKRRPIGLVWVGAPLSSHAGLLVLLGTYDDPRAAEADPTGWPLPLSRDLGVRIYQSGPA